MNPDPMPGATWEQRVTAAARVLARDYVRLHAMTPEDAAREAYQPGGPSVESLADRIRAQRQQHRTAA